MRPWTPMTPAALGLLAALSACAGDFDPYENLYLCLDFGDCPSGWVCVEPPGPPPPGDEPIRVCVEDLSDPPWVCPGGAGQDCEADATGDDQTEGSTGAAGDDDVAETADVGSDAGSMADVGPEPDAEPACDESAFECVCTSADDCDSGYCVKSSPEAADAMCTIPCVTNDECSAGQKLCMPTGWEAPQPAHLCASQAAAQCTTCEADTDCADSAGDGSDPALCVDLGDPLGLRCLIGCPPASQPCPESDCVSVTSVDGTTGDRCKPTDGAVHCMCTIEGNEAGFVGCMGAPGG